MESEQFVPYSDPNWMQLCMWPGTVVRDFGIKNFEQAMLDQFDVRVKYDQEVLTLPDLNENGTADLETGDRNDLFFWIHNDDISKFALARLSVGIRWWEDVIFYNHNSDHMYTKEFKDSRPPQW